MSNAIGIVKSRNNKTLSSGSAEAMNALSQIDDENRSFKGLQTPDFSDSLRTGAVIVRGEADSALYMGQDERYGTTLTPSGSGGDFSNKIVLAVGFLNDGKKDGDSVNLEQPDLRYGAGLTIYQRTDTGKDAVFDKSNPKNKDRKGTVRSPQTAVSVFEINADVVEVKARNGGVNIIAGYDPNLPNYGSANGAERANTEYLGVSLIFGNPDQATLSNEKSVYGLQPIPKGINLQKALQSAYDRIDDLSKVVFSMQTDMAILEGVLALHTHPVVAFGAGIATPSIELAVTSAFFKIPANVLNILKNITAIYNSAAASINASAASVAGINSKWNYTN